MADIPWPTFNRTRKFQKRWNSEDNSTRSWQERQTSAHSPLQSGPTEDQLLNPSGRTSILVGLAFFSIILCRSYENTHLANYAKLCNIEADLSHLPLTPLRGSQGGTYYRVDYDVVLLFGLTELKAMIAWEEEVRLSLLNLIHSKFLTDSSLLLYCITIGKRKEVWRLRF